MKQLAIFFCILYTFNCWQCGNAQRTSLMRQQYQEQERKMQESFNGGSAKHFVRNYVGDPEADMTVVSFIFIQ